MPAKYHIHTANVPNRYPTITRSGVIAWEEGCLKCPRCVKRECVYGVYDKKNLDARLMVDSLDSLCKDCFRCVQNCPNRLIHKSLNPEYKNLGDDYWTPEIISKLWYQAETGKNSRIRGRVRRAFLRSGIRCHVDGHVGDCPSDPGRDPRPGVYQYPGGSGTQMDVPRVR